MEHLWLHWQLVLIYQERLKWRKRLTHLKNHPGVVVSYHVGVSVLGLVHLHRRVVPGELLARLYALVFLRELHVVIPLQIVDVKTQLLNWDGRVRNHTRCLVSDQVWSLTQLSVKMKSLACPEGKQMTSEDSEIFFERLASRKAQQRAFLGTKG